MDKVATAQLRHNVPGTLPLDRREKISRYLASSVGHGGRHEGSKAHAEEDSDSGDSLFLTQAVAIPRDLMESEDILLSSSSNVGQWRRRKKYSLPTYNFPFLKNRKRRLRGTPFPDQNKELHHYMIGGFFKCLGELRESWQRGETLESSLPTVDVDGEHISPLSEEDEERSEDEDIKVVERKYFVSLSTKKSKQNWCNQLKKQDRGKGTNTGEPPQTETCCNKQIGPCTLKDVQRSLDSESSDNGKSFCNVLDQKGRKAKHGAGDGNLLATTDTQKTRCLARGDGNVSSLRKASEEGQKANDAGVLEFQRGLRRDSQKGGRPSEPVTGQEGDKPGGQHLLRGHPDRTSVSVAKMRKKYGPRAATSVTMEAGETPGLSDGCKAARTGEVLQMNGKNGMGDLSRDGSTLRQEEGDIPDSTQKKKNESLAERVGQEDGNAESEVRVENDGKKKRRKGGGKDVEHLQPSAVAELPYDGAEIQKEKKKKKVLGSVMTEEPNAGGALNRTLDLPAESTEQLGESGNCLENVETSQETSKLCFVKRKKNKKKQQSLSNDAPDQRKEGVDLRAYLGDSVTTATGSRSTPKEKRTIFEEINDSFYTEKKKSEIVSRDKCEDILAQNDDSASKRKKEKKKKRKKSSFLVADVEENDVPTHGELELEVRASDQEELGVTDQKKKRKMSVVQDSVEKNHEENGQEPGKTRRKRKRKRAGSESEGLVGAPDAGFPPLDEASELKKEKRYYDVIEEDPLTAKDGSTHDEATTETPGNQALQDTRNKKKKTFNADRGESAKLECKENKKKQARNEKSTVVETFMKKKLKRKLYNPNEEFFTSNSFKAAD